VDYVIDYKELKELFKKFKIKSKNKEDRFDKFYNDYTKVYPLAGGLSKTAHLKEVLRINEFKIVEGIEDLSKFLENPDKNIRFLDVTFCKGSCIGGPCMNSKLPIFLRRKKVLSYMGVAEKERIPEERKGVVEKAKGIFFKSEYPDLS
jgi:iron only hydrogenase large subunit-like protein